MFAGGRVGWVCVVRVVCTHDALSPVCWRAARHCVVSQRCGRMSFLRVSVRRGGCPALRAGFVFFGSFCDAVALADAFAVLCRCLGWFYW